MNMETKPIPIMIAMSLGNFLWFDNWDWIPGLVLSPSVSLPVVVSEGMLEDSPEVLPPSFLVTSIGELLASLCNCFNNSWKLIYYSELFEFPIVLSTDGSRDASKVVFLGNIIPIDHFESFSLVGDVIVQIMMTMGSKQKVLVEFEGQLQYLPLAQSSAEEWSLNRR
mgnify:CR=1 FL=1